MTPVNLCSQVIKMLYESESPEIFYDNMYQVQAILDSSKSATKVEIGPAYTKKIQSKYTKINIHYSILNQRTVCTCRRLRSFVRK